MITCFSRIPDANPRRMLLIGDSPASDIKGGMAAGTYTCWYNPADRRCLRAYGRIMKWGALRAYDLLQAPVLP